MMLVDCFCACVNMHVLGGCGRDFYQPVDIFFDCIAAHDTPSRRMGDGKPRGRSVFGGHERAESRLVRDEVPEHRVHRPHWSCLPPSMYLLPLPETAPSAYYLTYLFLCHPIDFPLACALLCSKVSLQRLCMYVCMYTSCMQGGWSNQRPGRCWGASHESGAHNKQDTPEDAPDIITHVARTHTRPPCSRTTIASHNSPSSVPFLSFWIPALIATPFPMANEPGLFSVRRQVRRPASSFACSPILTTRADAGTHEHEPHIYSHALVRHEAHELHQRHATGRRAFCCEPRAIPVRLQNVAGPWPSQPAHLPALVLRHKPRRPGLPVCSPQLDQQHVRRSQHRRQKKLRSGRLHLYNPRPRPKLPPRVAAEKQRLQVARLACAWPEWH